VGRDSGLTEDRNNGLIEDKDSGQSNKGRVASFQWSDQQILQV
jgi:hypothetical protein